MNYQKIYNAIIENAKYEDRVKLRKNQEGYIYYEKHHILPKCLKGKDEKENKVLLTAREHFICHKLLTNIFPKERGLWLALKRFSYSKKMNLYKISSRDYDNIKRMLKLIPQKSHYQSWLEKYGKTEADKRKEEEIIKIKKTMTGVKYSKERREKSAKGHIGIIQKEITIQRRIEKTIGKKRERVICEYCNQNVAINTYKIHHGKKCKFNKK
jgi:hypothetical protein